ncbi:hypothetical protein [Planctomycetes bacterium K23_9]|uniref:hypothetical protein n=1 Tax=Stieleria marina TaxID=1930275 RepID=UPI0011A1FB50
MPSQFSLRRLLTFMLVIAFIFALGPYAYRQVRYFSQINKLRSWASEVERLPNRPESISMPMHGGLRISISTVEKTVAPDFSSATMEANANPDPSRFFVVPPGKWVTSIDSAIIAWEAHVRQQ